MLSRKKSTRATTLRIRTLITMWNKQDLKTSLINQEGEKVLGPPQSPLMRRNVYVNVDTQTCTVNVKQVDG